MNRDGKYKIVKEGEMVCVRHPEIYTKLLHVPLDIWEQSVKKDVDVNTSIHTITEQYIVNRLWYEQNPSTGK